jgi:hypothetical protein
MSPRRLRAVLALGEALVAELGLKQSNDVLGRWMAHRLARLIETAGTAPEADRPALEQSCAEAILEVWRHRNCLPQGRRPLEPAERILDVIAALDPEAERPVYARIALDWDMMDEDERPTTVERGTLEVAREFDRVARTVIQHLVARAAETMPDDTREWVVKAKAAGSSGSDIMAIHRLLQLGNRAADAGRREQERHLAALRIRIEDLDKFAAIAELVRQDLVAQLTAAEAEAPQES